MKTISIPAVSSGIFGFPKDKCAQIMTSVAALHFIENKEKTSLEEVRFTNNDMLTCNIFKNEMISLYKKYGIKS